MIAVADTAVAKAPARSPLLAGVRAVGPWLLGVVPFGLVIGVSSAQADIPALAGWLTGPLIFAGSAQLVTIQLLDTGAAPVVTVVAALVINVRLVLYSATMAPHWRGTSRWWQALGAATLVDPTLAIGVTGYERERDRRDGHLHYAGAATALFVAWLAAITVGATVGASLPPGLRLELVIPLFLAGEVVPRLDAPARTRAVGLTALVALAAPWIPLHLGTLLAVAGGVAMALRLEEGST